MYIKQIILLYSIYTDSCFLDRKAKCSRVAICVWLYLFLFLWLFVLRVKQPLKVMLSGDKMELAPSDATSTASSSGSEILSPERSHAASQPAQPAHPKPSPPKNHFEEWCAAHLQGFGKQKQLTILLLGQTGSGKSSFLNLLGNFPTVMQHGQEAVAGKMSDFRNLEFENDLKDRKVSQTSAATVYEVDMGPLSLKIVDTPGFGDTRGRAFDEKHTKLIVDCVKNLGQVNAIAFVISGRESRLTAQLKYVLMEVCAILPKAAKNNIVAIFTNTTSPLYLSFDIDALNGMVEHQVKPERQIFIENPYVLWERSKQNKGKVDDAALQMELVKAFKDAGENLAKLFAAMLTMPKMNTTEFERLYNLRQAIESNTMKVLAELECAQEEQKNLEQQKREIQRAQTEEDMNRHYMKQFHGKRWVFKDSDGHGTFCGVKNCHSNCHAPCKMEKTPDNAKFKMCSAFRYTEKKIRLRSKADRKDLLRYMVDENSPFHADEDGGNGTQYETVLRGAEDFQFQAHHFMKGAFVEIPGSGSRVGWAAKSHLMELRLPAEIYIADQSDQDTCKVCGHDRKYHFHDEKIWCEEEYSEEVVDEATKQKYEAAKDLKERKEKLLKGIQGKIEQCGKRQKVLGATLLSNIRQFEQHGLSRNYAMLLQNQRDLFQQHIDATLENDDGADVSQLKKAKEEVEKALRVVQENLLRNKGADSLEWACSMLGVSREATLDEIKQKFKEEAKRQHPDKQGSDERMKQINEAFEILKKQKESKWWRRF